MRHNVCCGVAGVRPEVEEGAGQREMLEVHLVKVNSVVEPNHLRSGSCNVKRFSPNKYSSVFEFNFYSWLNGFVIILYAMKSCLES